MIKEKDIQAATMWINGVDIYDRGVLVESFKVGGTPINNEIYQGRNQTDFQVIASTFGLKEISVNLFFSGRTRREITLKKSAIDGLLYGKIELGMPDGFQYTAAATSAGELQILGVENNQVIALCTYTFQGIQHDPLVVSTGNVVDCRSTIPKTDVKLTCTASRAYSALTIETVTITGVRAGDVITIDGQLKRILQNGAPCPGNMAFLKFPQLDPGVNTLNSPEQLTVEYYPTYA